MRSLADKGWEKPKPSKFSPFSGLLVVLVLAWILATVWLLNYYWENSGLKADNEANRLVNGHARLDRSEAAGLGLGLTMRNVENGTDPAIGQLMELRQTLKSGTSAEQAIALQALREDARASDNEAYRTTMAPVLSCAASDGCDNGVFVQTAAELASRQPRWVGHAMIIEANYWRQARAAGDSSADAAALARLDRLVRESGTPELKIRWVALEACGRDCPVFGELLIGFVQEAARN